MKLQDPDLNRQLQAAVHRFEQLPSWMKDASSSQRTQDQERVASLGCESSDFAPNEND